LSNLSTTNKQPLRHYHLLSHLLQFDGGQEAKPVQAASNGQVST
jgi:hypothetical protein